MRISGVILVVMALGHMLMMHVVAQLTGQEVNFAFVSSRWGTRSGGSTTWCSSSSRCCTASTGADHHWRSRSQPELMDAASSALPSSPDLADRGDDRDHRLQPGNGPGLSRWAVLLDGRRVRPMGRSVSRPRDCTSTSSMRWCRRRGRGPLRRAGAEEELGAEARVAVMSKLYPSRSHTGAAQGGVVRRAGQHRGGPLGVALVRHGQGWRLPGRPGRGRVMCHDAVETIINLEHLGLPFNRTPEGLIDQRRFGGHTRNYGEGRRAPQLLRRRPHRPCHPPHALPAVHQARGRLLRRVPGARPGDARGPDGPVTGVVALELATRRDPHLPRSRGPLRHGRLRQDLQGHLQRAHADRRRGGDRLSARDPAGGHGVLPVPPHRHVQAGLPPLGGGARRGRHPAQRQRASASWSATRRP